MEKLHGFETWELIVAAARYYTGRRTISTCFFARTLADNWKSIPERAQEIIRKDLELEFKRDDEARERNDGFLPLGDDCDRAAWEQVKNAWILSQK